MVGSIKSHTKNFKFIIPEFNVATWHDYIEENFRSIDALFQNLFGINGFSGMWKTNTAYEAGQVLFVGEDNGSIYEGRLVKVIQDTNTGGFATFSEAIKTNPTHYEFYTDASSAQIFAELSKSWASHTGSTVKTPEGDDTGEYSAKHYQTLAKGNEEQCEMYKNLTDTNVQLTQEAVVSAETFAQNSETSAQNSLVSEQNSKTSETNSKASEQNAKNSEQNAKSSEDNAKIYETNAANSVETQTNNFNSYNNQLLSTTSAGVSELINTKTSSIVELNSKVSNALSEINSKTNVLDKTMITNCITYIPQDVKLELNDGTLTLKAGSKVYDCKGNIININNDLSIGKYGSTSTQLGICVNSSGTELVAEVWSYSVSGTTAPPSGFIFNTSTNVISRYSNSTQTHTNLSLPICVVSRSSGTLTSIDQVFNGFGYIGSTVFALPGVKGLIPNGRNEDGSLKNIEFVLDRVSTMTYPATGTNLSVSINSNGDMGTASAFIVSKTKPSGEYVLWYNPIENLNRYKSTGDFSVTGNKTLPLGVFSSTATQITSFQPKTTFHALDYNDKSTIVGWGMPDYSAEISISSPYTPTQNGFITLCVTGAYTKIILKENDINIVDQYDDENGANQQNILRLIPVTKGKVYSWTRTNGTLTYAKFTPSFGG